MPKPTAKLSLKPNLDAMDHQLIELLKVNARLPLVNLAKALGCARSTAQLRLKALEDAGVITGYTVSVSSTRGPHVIRAMVLISIDSRHESTVVKELSKRHEITKVYSVSGRYDLCAMLLTDSTQELDAVLDRIRNVQGVEDTFSTILLSTKLDRPE
ncbi:MAG: Lrp/AsnC family transcriptional regulator [Burkholderiales bacterium]|nr:Lrp/AsnC family transcriptional regulator [Burkholderiales bacterium]MDE2075600.1 Lrp/AsnC family transcriptional regulator [Burkholderiales bacterium]MDE2432896.1 Lrp/AsnC family transcriptional regulator [Burkholderiales bacterium]HET8693796.1 Lrp/AsnC family transcriptional regulator [Aquabacterium sp.]